MSAVQAFSAENILKTQDLAAFNEIYGKMVADVLPEHVPAVRAVCAKVFSSEEGRKILTDLAEKDIKLSSRVSENKIDHDLFGKYVPGDSFIGIGGIFSSEKQGFEGEALEEKAAFVQRKLERAPAFDLTQPVDKMFFFHQAVKRGDQSKEFYDFVDEGRVEHVILAENAASSEAKAKSEAYHFSRSQLREDRLLLRKYEAAEREPSLRPRYLRALERYDGDNKTVKALQTYMVARYSGEMDRARKEPLTDRIFSAVRSWGVRSGR